MTKRMPMASILMIAQIGLALLASGHLSGSWSSQITFEQGDILSLRRLDSVLNLNYSFGSFLSRSTSEFIPFGFIWQEFRVTGTLGTFDIQGDLLFGPSTGDYIYGQFIVQSSIAGIELGLYAAQLSDAVLQGPADGFALRLAASTGALDIEAVIEMAAQIEDEGDNDFKGITIYHAATGLHKHYVTNPVVVGQGFTGEKVTVSGWSFDCVEDIAVTLHMTCERFDFLKLELSRVDLGLSWLMFDVELTFRVQTKSVLLTTTFAPGKAGCINVYATLLTGAQDNKLYQNFTSITGIDLYGISFAYSWKGIKVKALTVLDTGHYAITTPEYGSVIEEITKALKYDHEYYPHYWELLSVEVTGGEGCRKGFTFLANTYFDKNATNLLGWGMTHIEGKFSISSKVSFTAEIEIDGGTPRLDHFGFGFEVGW